MFTIGDKVVAKPSAGIFGAVRKADAIDQPFLYIVSMTKHQTYTQCGVSHLPYSWGGEVSYVATTELMHYDESEMVERVIKKQHRIGVIRRNIEVSLEKKDKAAFMKYTEELKEVECEQGKHD